ncbi:uncharacterized protein SOCE836_080290 [Sorangium cellulosum]|uniref:Uncharacterized protein n=1 Tax=Sorangium cellulosum TaxID=56 RepID=A0A4P2QZS9_SORCE|nr:uncharacterized protein SOCE836_080290 [Sorangium cellulosum]WCQ95127.1 hypothetical protein NQZ70_07902 [Sorangium sp. Soce836]
MRKHVEITQWAPGGIAWTDGTATDGTERVDPIARHEGHRAAGAGGRSESGARHSTLRVLGEGCVAQHFQVRNLQGRVGGRPAS